MIEEELLEKERVEGILSPHPLSFPGLLSICFFLTIWGGLLFWLVNVSEYKDLFVNYWLIILTWSIVILIAGVVASLVLIRWRVFFLYLFIVVVGVIILFWQNWQDTTGFFIPFYTIMVSIFGFIIVELYRRSHKYIISNQRIIFRGGIITKQERTLRYDKIADVNYKQGILGQIFGFGTIIPISQSGFGLGSDKSFAAAGLELGEKKTKLLGIFGGGKEVQTPLTRSYFELHGVYPFKKIKKIIEELVQASVITPYQQEQVAFQKEQLDIQKQMRDLLKLQSESKTDKEE